MSEKGIDSSSQTVLITGGSGLVGAKLSDLLTENGYVVTHLSRTPSEGKYRTYKWDVKKGIIDEEAIKSADIIVHLAGASVAGRRWTAEYKKAIYDSRIDSTRLLRAYVERVKPDLSYFLGASAIGYYGMDSGDKIMKEDDSKGEGFLADVTEDWESEAQAFNGINVKNGQARIGVVLSKEGGALVEMMKPINMLVGAPIGSGQQYMSWIHIDDLVSTMLFMIKNRSEEIYNAVAQQPETNENFTKILAKQLRKPLWLPNVPTFVLKLLFGEMSSILIGGNRVSSKKIELAGFSFKFRTLEAALQDILLKK